MSSNGKQKHQGMTDYDRHMLRAQDTHNWFHCRRDYWRIMEKMAALLLQDLMNRAAAAIRKNRMADDGYFRCSRKYLQNGLWTEREQRTYLNHLIKAGYIKTIRRGTPGSRWVKINLRKIEEDLDEIFYG